MNIPMPEVLKILEISKEPIINISLDTIQKQKQALIFASTKRGAEKTAEEIALKIKTSDAELINLAEKALKALSKPTKQCQRLATCLKKGVAFHHAGLTAKQRELIEDSFREGLIKIIAATPTLAYGLDLPAFRSIIKDYKRYGGRWGMQNIPVLEIMQMWGRAGRPGKDTEGQAICIAKSDAEKDALYETYILGVPEDIYSKLAVEPVLRTYLLSLISTEFVKSKKQILDFFSKTFWASQYGDMYELHQKIDKMLKLLEEYEFISSSKKEFASADDLDNEKYKATIIGQRVSQLYLDPLTAHRMIIGMRRSTSKLVISFTLLHMVASQLELRPLLRTKVKEYEIVEEKVNKFTEQFLMLEPPSFDPEYEEFLNAVKTAMFLEDWIEEKDEPYLMQTYDIRPGEIKGKLDIADWLLYSSEELAKLMQFQDLIKHLSKLRFRLKYGVKEELLPLLRLKNIGRVRARRLFGNKIKTLGDIKKVDIMTLIQILGKKVAINIKEQVGEKVEGIKISENKRKGQMSLNKY